MRVLLYQYRPAIRLYKWAYTLKKHGVDVVVAYDREIGLNLKWDRFNCKHISSFSNFKDFDRYVSFNPMKKYGYTDDCLTIQAVGDLKSANAINQDEIDILAKSYRCIYVSDEQMKFAQGLVSHSADVYYNGVIDEMIGELKQKIVSDKLELVYSGTITNIDNHHRNIINKLKLIKKNNNCNIHIYPSFVSKTDGYGDFIVHNPVSPYELISELSQYHGGLFILNHSKEVCDMSLPNKYFEYCASNIPIITESYQQIISIGGVNIMRNYTINELIPPNNSTYYKKDLIDKIL